MRRRRTITSSAHATVGFGREGVHVWGQCGSCAGHASVSASVRAAVDEGLGILRPHFLGGEIAMSNLKATQTVVLYVDEGAFLCALYNLYCITSVYKWCSQRYGFTAMHTSPVYEYGSAAQCRLLRLCSIAGSCK